MHSGSDRRDRGHCAMAELAEPILDLRRRLPGLRRAARRAAAARFPAIADDFDWRARDYDSFRLFMMQELAYRFPERRRWTPADVEVVIVELLAAALDRASHALDAVQAERYLETARRPQSVRRLLKLIGYDAVERIDPALLDALPPHRAGVTETPRREARALLAAQSGGDGGGPRRRPASDRRAAPHGDARRPRDAAGAPPAGRACPRRAWSGPAPGHDAGRRAARRRSRPRRSAACRAAAAARRPAERASTSSCGRRSSIFHRVERLAAAAGQRQRSPRAACCAVMIERYRMVGSEVLLETRQGGADHLHALGPRQAAATSAPS